jgi:hypothetical protein
MKYRIIYNPYRKLHSIFNLSKIKIMNFTKTAVILALSSAVLISAGCGGAASNSNAANAAANESATNANVAKTNVEELGLLINMPYETEEAVWRGGQDQKKLVAVLRFSSEDANKLVEQAKKAKPPVSEKVESESWFPAELIAQSDMSGDDTLKGTTYAADQFFQPPYNEGKLTRIEGTDYFVLELTAK